MGNFYSIEPLRKTFKFPGEIKSQCSLLVNGFVAITVTTSLEEVSFLKSTCQFLSIKEALPKGALRVTQLSAVEQ